MSLHSLLLFVKLSLALYSTIREFLIGILIHEMDLNAKNVSIRSYLAIQHKKQCDTFLTRFEGDLLKINTSPLFKSLFTADNL